MRVIGSCLRPHGHVLPDAARVDDVEVAPLGQRNHLEFIVVDKENRDLAAAQRLVDIHEPDAMVGEFGGQPSAGSVQRP